MKMVPERHPMVADVILRAMAARREAPAIEAINQSVENLLAVGYDVPTWCSLMTNTNAPTADVPTSGGVASCRFPCSGNFFYASDSEAASLRSQGGFGAYRQLSMGPDLPVGATAAQSAAASSPPTLLTSRTCRCGRPLDVLGHHRSACAVVERLSRRGFPLENAAARVCQEAGRRGRTTASRRGPWLHQPA